MFSRIPIAQGVSVLQRQDGTFYQIDGPADEDVAASAAAFLGGYVYLVSDDLATQLSNAGYGGWLYAADYGMGDYGAGPYGGGMAGTLPYGIG